MRIVSIILLISLFSVIALCQGHFVFEGSNWYFSNPDDTLGNPLADYTYYEYVSDTLVEGENCKFIHSSAGDHVIFLEKEDKVYYYARERFNLLYDFDVNENDTIYLDMWTYTFLMSPTDEFILIDTILLVKCIVKEVDSIAVDNYYLKKIFVDIFPESEILEFAVWPSGFGYFEYLGYTEDGIIPLVIKGIGPAINTKRNLRCYSDSRFFFMDSYWEQFGVGCDFSITPVNELHDAITISAYPNPVKDILRTNLNNNYSYQLELRDSAGRLILLQDLLLRSSEIRVEKLESGFYILIIKNSDQNFYQTLKILKI